MGDLVQSRDQPGPLQVYQRFSVTSLHEKEKHWKTHDIRKELNRVIKPSDQAKPSHVRSMISSDFSSNEV
ncbi:unnamed protein product [Clavelina lepadiformis]|uniref:Uncharacterized protein n=1 Tax=Clavelina lepadiformis TaxID=159417 RepID=A0ABP0EXZ6_CLALP